MADEKTAGAVIIGDEILSGRTKDTNLNTIALYCEEIGVALKEGRTVGDSEAAIVEAVNALRARYDYVFTTGGIGPTHDDITAECIAKAFGVPLIHHPEAVALLKQQLGERYNESRARMARTPQGAVLIDNPVSVGPGFMTGNVITMAGIPNVMKAMLESARPFITGGPKVLSEVIHTSVPEGDLAAPLGEIQTRFPAVSIGSYPAIAKGASPTASSCAQPMPRCSPKPSAPFKLLREQSPRYEKQNPPPLQEGDCVRPDVA